MAFLGAGGKGVAVSGFLSSPNPKKAIYFILHLTTKNMNAIRRYQTTNSP
jgi:acyl CoA:acetate/3-ketoacid CoA transferase alpha subunit